MEAERRAEDGGGPGVPDGVGGGGGGTSGEGRGRPGGGRDPRREDDPPYQGRLSVGEGDAEATIIRFDPRDGPRVEVWKRAGLEPLAVRDEVRDGDRTLERGGALVLEGVKTERGSRIADVRCRPAAAQAHALRHVLHPKGHRVSEHVDVGAGPAQLSGHREPVRARTDHGDIVCRGHVVLLSCDTQSRVSHERATKSRSVSASMSPVTASALRAPSGHRQRRTSGPGEDSIAASTDASDHVGPAMSRYAPKRTGSSEISVGNPSSTRNGVTSGGDRRDTPTVGSRSESASNACVLMRESRPYQCAPDTASPRTSRVASASAASDTRQRVAPAGVTRSEKLARRSHHAAMPSRGAMWTAGRNPRAASRDASTACPSSSIRSGWSWMVKRSPRRYVISRIASHWSESVGSAK